MIELKLESCSNVYASPLILEHFLKSNNNEPFPNRQSVVNIDKLNLYNPLKEDVFSLGVVLLQIATMTNSS